MTLVLGPHLPTYEEGTAIDCDADLLISYANLVSDHQPDSYVQRCFLY